MAKQASQQIRSDKFKNGFDVSKAKLFIEDYLETKFLNRTYASINRSEFDDTSIFIKDKMIQMAQNCDLPYRFVVHVYTREVKNEPGKVRIKAQCYWEESNDHAIRINFQCPSFICTVIVFIVSYYVINP
ncbi:hypothetical protein ACOME3_007882 [Neoechinorhynchus agilis]